MGTYLIGSQSCRRHAKIATYEAQYYIPNLGERSERMTIQVKFFASLRERLGKSEAELPLAEATAAEVWRQATDDLEPPANLLVAINMEYAGMESIVKAGDEVAFFPPVTGG